MKIRSLLVTVVMALCLLAVPVCAESLMVEYSVSELDTKISLPEEYAYVITRDLSEDDPVFVELGLSKEDLFANESVYFEAITENRGAELILTVMTTDWSEMYYDFNNLSDDELLDLAELCLVSDGSEMAMEYSDYGIFDENEDVRFLQAQGDFQGETVSGSTVQYVTVQNGAAYTFTFNFIGTELSDKEIAMTEEVIASVDLGDVVPRDNTESNTLFIVIIVALLVVIGVLLAIIRKQKYTVKNLNEDLERSIEEEQE